MALVQRLLRATFRLGQGQFGESGTNTVTVDELRMSAKIVKAGGPSMGTMQLTVYGMTLSLMNQLSTLGLEITTIRRNTITLEAGDTSSGMGTVFIGTITNAWADMQSAPDTGFHVEAHTGLIEAIAPAAPSSFNGSADVSTIMQGLATLMGLKFENTGVNVKLSNPYFFGSARNQAQACADAAGINWIIDNGILAIWPRGQARGAKIPLISAETGMWGYPSYVSKGIMVRTIYNPSIGYGSKIQVQSTETPANGTWVVFGLDHDLESKVPKGQWFSTIQAARPGLVVLQ